MRRQGFSLIEVIIAVAIFSGLMAVAFEAMMRMRSLASTVEDIDQLDDQARDLQKVLRRDLINSAWFFCAPGAAGQPFFPQIHRFGVTGQNPVNSVSIYKNIGSPAVPTLTTVTATVTANLATSFGDALVFTRLAPEGIPASTTSIPHLGPAVIAIASTIGNQKATRMSDYNKARPVSCLVVDPSATDQASLAAATWETTPAMITAGLGPTDLYNDSKVRLFCYRVEPDPRNTGRGILRRYYSNPTATGRNTFGAALVTNGPLKLTNWILDADIVTDVLSFRVETIERTSTLAANQIRFVVDLGRNLSQVDVTKVINTVNLDATDSNVISREVKTARSIRRVEFTVSMRSITNTTAD